MTIKSKVMTSTLAIVLSVSGAVIAAEEKKVADGAAQATQAAAPIAIEKSYAGFASQEEQICYIVGVNFGQQLKAQFAKADLDMLIKGMNDIIAKKDLVIPVADHQSIMEKFSAAASGSTEEAAKIKLKDYAGFSSDDQKASYVVGVSFAGSIESQPFKVSAEKLVSGIKDSFNGKDLAIPQADHQGVMYSFREKMVAKMEKERQDRIDAVGWKMKLEKPAVMKFDAAKDYIWVLETNKGTVKIKLWPDVAPMHVTSTIFLTNKKFYDDLTFHRVIPGFMAQGGCPLGDGTGNPGYEYDGEIKEGVVFDKPMLLAMANAGEGTDGSQFFITYGPATHLNGKHTIFGEVIEGKDVMTVIEKLGSPIGQTKEPVTIKKATIVETAKK